MQNHLDKHNNLSIPSKTQFEELTAWCDQYAKLRPGTTYKRWVFDYGIGEKHFPIIAKKMRRKQQDPLAELRDLPLFAEV